MKLYQCTYCDTSYRSDDERKNHEGVCPKNGKTGVERLRARRRLGEKREKRMGGQVGGAKNLDESLAKQDSEKTEYTKGEIRKMSGAELEKLMHEPGWVFKDGKVVRVSEEEYQEAVKNYEKHQGYYDGESI